MPWRRLLAAASLLAFSATLLAQDIGNRPTRLQASTPVSQDAAVPKLIKFSGSVPVSADAANGSAPVAPAPTSMTFSIYADETATTPLFVESQNVTPDTQGKYSVLLGSSNSEGLPAEIFSQNQARWLEVKLSDGTVQPRVMLVSVPYSLKSLDTEKLGGVDAKNYLQSTDLAQRINDILESQYGMTKDQLKSARLGAKAKPASEAPVTGASPVMMVTSDSGNVFRINTDGQVFSSGGYFVGGADFAESVETVSPPDAYDQGDVMVIDPSGNRMIDLSDQPYSTRVAGIVSTKPGLFGSKYNDPTDPHLDKEVPLAVVGIVPCKVSTENGPIAVGDLLVTSSTVGFAMKGTDRSKMLGAVLGKAMQPLKSGKGVIQVLVTLQ